ncbi:hypothetical protein ANN_04744 [Periplaneta americana]|uniref:Uncharacterized protein n=1 Tax=Periplaneta americana TaxID=6978 RepID=A0ABQ8T9B0_PERAM|nr:hypothetical protein ANN_04744 [Periplaneta americana]
MAVFYNGCSSSSGRSSGRIGSINGGGGSTIAMSDDSIISSNGRRVSKSSGSGSIGNSGSNDSSSYIGSSGDNISHDYSINSGYTNGNSSSGGDRSGNSNVGQKIVFLPQQGFRMRETGHEIGRRHSDVVRTWNLYRMTQNVENLPRSDRPRSTTPAEDRYLRITVQGNREDNATQLRHALQSEKVSTWTTYTPRDIYEQHR